MGQVIFAADSAYHPVGQAASIHVVQARGTQYAYMQPFQLGEPYRSDARRNVRFDNAPGSPFSSGPTYIETCDQATV